MDVVYVFFDSEKARIPFYDFDEKLFSRFSGSALGGRWDDGKARRDCAYQYIIPLLNYDKNIIERLCGGKPFIEINKDRRYPVIVNCFFSNATIVPDCRPSPASPSGTASVMFSEFWRGELETAMRARKYSANTRAAYMYHNQSLCGWGGKIPEEITTSDIKNYLSYKEKIGQFSASSLNLALSAFKFFYGVVLNRNTAREQKRPRQDKRLPVVLSKSEIKKIIVAESNLKHRILLMIVYASGLRVSEVVRLKRCDIDAVRKVIRVNSSKGRKDRYTILSDTIIPFLKHYYARYRITGWLFPGAGSDSHLSIRTAQRICELALKKAHIHKDASIHSLRHAFATHLLENGADINYIKELLGHVSVHTTERYTHIAKQKILKMISPLDTLDKGD